jgi:hypothetical protein
MALRAAAGQAFGAGTGPHRASVSLPAEGQHHLGEATAESPDTIARTARDVFQLPAGPRISIPVRSPRTRPASDTAHTAAASRWTVKSCGRDCAHACRSAGSPDVQGSVRWLLAVRGARCWPVPVLHWPARGASEYARRQRVPAVSQYHCDVRACSSKTSLKKLKTRRTKKNSIPKPLARCDTVSGASPSRYTGALRKRQT